METRELTSYFHEFYIKKFEAIRKKYENVDYVLPYVKYKYIYKGNDVERAVRANLKKIKAHANDINSLGNNDIIIKNCGYGELAWTFALVHRDTQVYAFEADEDKFLIASHCSYIPQNLHFVKEENDLPKYVYLIDNQSFLR